MCILSRLVALERTASGCRLSLWFATKLVTLFLQIYRTWTSRCVSCLDQ